MNDDLTNAKIIAALRKYLKKHPGVGWGQFYMQIMKQFKVDDQVSWNTLYHCWAKFSKA